MCNRVTYVEPLLQQHRPATPATWNGLPKLSSVWAVRARKNMHIAKLIRRVRKLLLFYMQRILWLVEFKKLRDLCNPHQSVTMLLQIQFLFLFLSIFKYVHELHWHVWRSMCYKYINLKIYSILNCCRMLISKVK